MQRFKNILFCTEGKPSDLPALETAMRLAAGNEGKLTVFNVVEKLPRELLRLAAAMPSGALENMAMDEARGSIEGLVASAAAIGPPAEIKIACGRPGIEIVRAVLHHHYDLVILSGCSHKGIRSRIFGSTGMRLMRKCPCPVWVIQTPREKPIARILAAVDPDPMDEPRDSLNTKIMELALSQARMNGGELHVAHAWQPIDEPSRWGWQKEIPASEIDEWSRQIRDEHQRSLANLIARFDAGGVPIHAHLLEGDAESVIPETAVSEQIDLIVMGTLAHVGIEGYFIGNTAEKVLERVSCSVLAVKPDGFVSPVKLD